MLLINKKPKLKLLQQTLQNASPHKLTKIVDDVNMLGISVSFLSYPDQVSFAKACKTQLDSLAEEDTESQAKKIKTDDVQDDFDSTPGTL